MVNYADFGPPAIGSLPPTISDLAYQLKHSYDLPSYRDYARLLDPFRDAFNKYYPVRRAAHNRAPRRNQRSRSSSLRTHRVVQQQQDTQRNTLEQKMLPEQQNYQPLQQQQKWLHANRWKLVSSFETVQTNRIRLAEEEIEAFADIVNEMVETGLSVFRELRPVMEALAETPIMIGTGSYQTVEETRIVRRKEAQQSYSDREGELANSLTNLPKFTACLKVGNQQGIVSIPPVRKPDADKALIARRTRIVTQTHRQYSNEKEEVEKEIEQRHNELRNREKPIAQTTSDDDEE